MIQGQSLSLADNLIKILNEEEFTRDSTFQLLRKIAHEHPDRTVALDYANRALDLAIMIENKKFEAQAYEEIGVNQRLLGNSIKAVEANLRALAIFEELKDDRAITATLTQLGSNSVSDGRPVEAISYFKKALDLYAKLAPTGLNYALASINLGEAYRLSDRKDSAVFHFEKALALNDAFNNQIIEGYARGNLGMALRSKGELEEAKTELLAANEILTELGDPYSVSVYTADLALISMAEGKLQLAEEQLLTAYTMAKSEGLKEQIRDFSEMLVDFYEGQGNYAEALTYQKVYQVYQDSLVNKENVQQVERLKANYEIDKREGEISLLTRLNKGQRTFNIVLGGGILIFGIFAMLLYQSYRQKNEANAMLAKQQVVVTQREEEKAILLKELNHRVKNNLQMVSSLLNLQENQLQGHPAAEAIQAGKSRVEALSLIHQKLYQDDVHTTINIKEYLEQLVSNLLYSFGSPLQPELDIQNLEMDIDTAIPVSLIVNELVTNALKYAYKGVDDPALSITLHRPNGYHYLEVADNGVGIDNEKDTSNSFGLKLVNSLVQQMEGELKVTDNQGQGTSWNIRLNAYDKTES